MGIFKIFIKEMLDASDEVNKKAAENTDPFRPDDYNHLPIDYLHDSFEAITRKEFEDDL